jgi:hypothetical protein
MTFEERQHLLRLVVERITVGDGRVKVEIVIPTGQGEGKLRNGRRELVEPRPILAMSPSSTATLPQASLSHWHDEGAASLDDSFAVLVRAFKLTARPWIGDTL